MSTVKSTKNVKVRLPSDVEVTFEATQLGGEERVSVKVPEFGQVIDAISGIADAVKSAVVAAAPTKFSVELGVDVGIEAGKLTALIVKGTATANLKVTLEWSK